MSDVQRIEILFHPLPDPGQWFIFTDRLGVQRVAFGVGSTVAQIEAAGMALDESLKSQLLRGETGVSSEAVQLLEAGWVKAFGEQLRERLSEHDAPP